MSVTWEIREGDALARLAEMPAESVQCCVTSPPYFNLRDYRTVAKTWPGLEYELPGGTVVVEPMECALGLESTPVAFVGHLVLIFREVRRVLRSDGTLWLNIGDSYAGSWGAQSRAAVASSTFDGMSGRQIAAHPHRGSHTGSIPPGAQYKPKDLLGIPWLLAFALRADGWHLRSEVVWAKPNPMPESVTDRPTSAHEKLFLLAKSPSYFYDADAIREGYAPGSVERIEAGFKDRYSEVASGGFRGAYGGPAGEQVNPAGRNKRNVWTIATQAYAEAHFATFPPKLVEPCILAGSAAGDTVLDPFAGSGTTGLVALRHDRSFVGIELKPAYAEMARERIRNDAPLLNTTSEATPVARMMA